MREIKAGDYVSFTDRAYPAWVDRLKKVRVLWVDGTALRPDFKEFVERNPEFSCDRAGTLLTHTPTGSSFGHGWSTHMVKKATPPEPGENEWGEVGY